MKFCDVTAGAFGVSGCIHMRTMLRDVGSCAILTREREYRTATIEVTTEFVVFHQACVRGEHGKFVTDETESTD